MGSLNLKDKVGAELFAGDKVQIVNGAKSGTILYKIQASRKPFTIEGCLNEKDEKLGIVVIETKKVRKI